MDRIIINQGDDYSLVLEFRHNNVAQDVSDNQLHLTLIDSFGRAVLEFCKDKGEIKINGHVALIYLRGDLTSKLKEGSYSIEIRGGNLKGSSSDRLKNLFKIVKRVNHGC